MTIQTLSEDVVQIWLPEQPQVAGELAAINETVVKKGNCNVIIDFSKVEVLTSSNISNLIILHKTLSEQGRKLVLYNVSLPTKGVFTVTALTSFFNFAEDKAAALVALRDESQAGV